MGGRVSKGPPRLSPYEKAVQGGTNEAEQARQELAKLSERDKYLHGTRTGLTPRRNNPNLPGMFKGWD